MDSTPEETHKDDEDGVPNLQVERRACLTETFTAPPKGRQEIQTDLVEGGEDPRLLAGEAVALLNGGDGALHVARHQQLRQLQKTVAKHEELQGEGEEGELGANMSAG